MDALCLFVLAIVAIQTLFTLVFTLILIGPSNRSHLGCDSVGQPFAVIVLCVRGNDPFLRECIDRLLDQDYERYELHIVVDSELDPALPVVRTFENHPRVRIQFLENPPDTCGLKCASIVQAVVALDSTVGIVAFCDADCLPHRTWLADLAAPFADPTVGATTGNRWYHPPKASSAPLIRYLWNIPAAVNMVLLGIAWGGSLAIRRRVIHETGLLEKWSRSLCEDTLLFRVLRQHNYRQVFVPNVLMVNRESCTLHDLARWVPRQLLTAKLYHPSWPLTLGYGIISSIVPFLTIGLAGIGLIGSDAELVRRSLILLAGFEASNLILVLSCQWAASRRISMVNASENLFGARSLAALPFWILLSQLISPLSFLQCYFLKTVSWRGIDYQIRGPSIQRGEYSVFREASERGQSL